MIRGGASLGYPGGDNVQRQGRGVRTVRGLSLVLMVVIGLACSDEAPDEPQAIVNTTYLDFGIVAPHETGYATFVLANIGYGQLAGTMVAEGEAFAVSPQDYDLGPYESVACTVYFTPSAEQNYTGSILTGAAECPRIDCVGLGQGRPLCDVDPLIMYVYPTVGQPYDATFTISNTGGGVLAGEVTTTSPGFSIVGEASYSLTADESATITVRVLIAAMGSFSGVIETGQPLCDDLEVSGFAWPGSAQPRVPGDDFRITPVPWHE